MSTQRPHRYSYGEADLRLTDEQREWVTLCALAVVDFVYIPLFDALQRQSAYTCRFCQAVDRHADKIDHTARCPYRGAKQLLDWLLPSAQKTGAEEFSAPVPDTAGPDAPGLTTPHPD